MASSIQVCCVKLIGAVAETVRSKTHKVWASRLLSLTYFPLRCNHAAR